MADCPSASSEFKTARAGLAVLIALRARDAQDAKVPEVARVPARTMPVIAALQGAAEEDPQ